MGVTHTDQSREAFEQHVLQRLRKRDSLLSDAEIRDALLRFDDGVYYSDRYQAQYEAWKAATNHKAADVVLPEPDAWRLPDEERSVELGKPIFVFYGKSDFRPGTDPVEYASGMERLYTEQQVRALLAGVKDSLTAEPAVPQGWIDLTDEDRDRAFNSLPDMLDGFLKKWGWLHFAKAIEQICREKNSPQPPKEQT